MKAEDQKNEIFNHMTLIFAWIQLIDFYGLKIN